MDREKKSQSVYFGEIAEAKLTRVPYQTALSLRVKMIYQMI